MSLERVRQYITDVSAGLGQRDEYANQTRKIKMEMLLVKRSRLAEDNEEAKQFLTASKSAAIQADETARVAARMLSEITGISDIGDIRTHLMETKVRFSRLADLMAELVELRVQREIPGDSPDPDIYEAPIKVLEESLIASIPESYDPEFLN